MKLLVIKRDKIGDLLLTTPMLRHLRALLPEAEIHLLANDYNAWVVAGNTDIDKIWVYRRAKVGRRIRLGAIFSQIWLDLKLRRERFDVVLVAGGDESARAIKRALRVGGKRTVAYCRDPALASSVSDALPLPTGVHEADRMLGMLAALGIQPPSSLTLPRYVLPEEWRSVALEWVGQHGLVPGKYVVLGLGARRAKKQPTTAQILRWSAYFKETLGLDTVFMWTPGKSDNPLYPGDDEVAQPVLDAGISYIHPFRGPIMPALGLIWQARISIIPDSGLMHFAAASPGGVLGLFAETEVSPPPSQWGPRGRIADYLEAAKSVEELTDEQVFDKLRQLLAMQGPSGTGTD